MKFDFEITQKTLKCISEIERVKGVLEAISINQAGLEKLRKQSAASESHYSTHIEGTTLTLKQSENILLRNNSKGTRRDDALELMNYMKAFNLASKTGRVRIGEPDIKKYHSILVKGVRGEEASPGKYRTKQNYVVNSASGDVVYTPPPPDKVPALMKDFSLWLSKKDELHPVVKSAIAQFWLVHIHPFRDGNGRAARILSMLILFSAGYDFNRLFTLSEYYDKNRLKYYNAIQSARDTGGAPDLTRWIEYFCEGLKKQLVATEKTVIKSSEKSSEKILALFRKNPKMSAAQAAEILGITSRGVEKQISALKKAGKLKRIGGDKGGVWKVKGK